MGQLDAAAAELDELDELDEELDGAGAVFGVFAAPDVVEGVLEESLEDELDDDGEADTVDLDFDRESFR